MFGAASTKAALLAVLLLTPATGRAQPAAMPAAPGYGNHGLERLTERVHVARQPDRLWAAVIGNVTIVEQRDGFVLIDAGGVEGDGRRLVDFIRSLGPKPVKAVAITHWHGDHHLGLAPIAAAWPRVRIIATASTREMTEGLAARFSPLRRDPQADTARLNRYSATNLDFARRAADPSLPEEVRQSYALEADFVRRRMRDVAGTRIVLPNEIVSDRLVLADPVAPVELRHIGQGNTAGDLVAWLPRQRVLVTGDIVIAPTPYAFNVSPAAWTRTLERLKDFRFDWLVPGHGAPQRDAVYLDRMIAALGETRARVAELVGRNRTLEQVRAEIDLSAQRTRFVGDSAWGRLWFDGYWLEPLISSAYREARGEPIVEGS